MYVVTDGSGPAGHPAGAVKTAGSCRARQPRPGQDATIVPPAGQPGHGLAAALRRQPARIVNGRIDGGYTGVFEIICRACGDHPDLDYIEVGPRLQALRGPYPLDAGLAAYERHIGPAS
jgi:hypothetical protein